MWHFLGPCICVTWIWSSLSMQMIQHLMVPSHQQEDCWQWSLLLFHCNFCWLDDAMIQNTVYLILSIWLRFMLSYQYGCGYLKEPWCMSLWPSDAIWWHRSWSTLARVMACCLMAPSHYLSQCWFIIKCVLWHSPESNFTKSAHEINLQHVLRDYTSKITTTSPRGQWVKRKFPWITGS